jgi:hypothetical protein
MLGKALLSASVSAAPAVYYVEDVFSTYLYTGNGSTQTITNGIDLAGEGGLVWVKIRSFGNHALTDTVRGGDKTLSTSGTFAESSPTVMSFNSDGWNWVSGNFANTNANDQSYASWTFRKAAKFFDVVTFNHSNTAATYSHNLGSVPGMIIVKNTTSTGLWYVYHRSLGSDKFARFDTPAATTSISVWDDTNPTATEFTVGNVGNGTCVAYLFAHNAGGFGDAGTDNVISCGSYTGNGSTNGPTIDLGYEPQWLMIKRTNSTGNWFMEDTMRGMNLTGSAYLSANLSSDEQVFPTTPTIAPNATGFQVVSSGTGYNASGSTYIYIAIRRGPMKVPTDGTEVFAVDTDGSTLNNGVAFTSGWPVDYALLKEGSNSTDGWYAMSRLQGNGNYLQTNNINAEASGIAYGTFDHNTGWFSTPNASYSWMFRRAPGFFDVVAYTGTGSGVRNIAHNLQADPSMLWLKRRNGSSPYGDWYVQTTGIAASQYLTLNVVDAKTTSPDAWDSTYAASTVFTVGPDNNVSTFTYVAYLFATLAGVSKVGSYTGTGTTLSIDCGFTAGARFVLIKRTDSTGDWYVWDTARGIVSGDDPYLLLNSSDAEVTNTDYIDPLSSGFQISSTAPAAINASGGSFIFLAIA